MCHLLAVRSNAGWMLATEIAGYAAMDRRQFEVPLLARPAATGTLVGGAILHW